MSWGNAVCRSWHIASFPPLLSSVPLWPSAAFNSGPNGVQLRRHWNGGGQVPQPRPRHHADRRCGVAQDDAEELVVRVVRSRSRPRRPQVRLRAGHSRRVLQVPAPPHQLPRPRPPGVPSVPGHHRVVVVVLPHRRGAVTEARPPKLSESRNAHPAGRRGQINGMKT
ncbi:hypothetical protein EJB05_38152, partial [Eragrostis curvula]